MSSRILKRRSRTEQHLKQLICSTVCADQNTVLSQASLSKKQNGTLTELVTVIGSQKRPIANQCSKTDQDCSMESSEQSDNGQSHECRKECWRHGTMVEDAKLYSPLHVPLKLGWKRVVSSTEGSPEVYYIAPCGKRIDSIEDILMFLLKTQVREVHISQFTFDPLCRLETQPCSDTPIIDDISCGKEPKPISCVNTVNSERPEEFEYISDRTHPPEVPLLSDSESMACCSCTDDDGTNGDGGNKNDGCRNRSKCGCWQLTIEEAQPLWSKHTVGYVYGRLRGHQYSAIYECNPLCRCGPQCANRLVQHGLTHRLQVFRSPIEELKWGVRTLDDIPQGAFVCTYIGHMYSEAESDRQAELHGDDYFAELDYTEVLRQQTQLMEAAQQTEGGDRFSLDSSLSSLSSDSCPSVDHAPSPHHSSVVSSRLSSHTSIDCSLTSSRIDSQVDDLTSEDSDTDDEEANTDHLNTIDHLALLEEDSTNDSSGQGRTSSPIGSAPPLSPPSHPHISPTPHTSTSPPSLSPSLSPHRSDTSTSPPSHSPTPSSQRSALYIMDAKDRGNIGRFINHSCSPNLFVQNVFIDTHDKRFPWVALFAKRRIKALEELTWDYNYQVGSLPERCVKCLCGSEECRGRLL